MGTHDLAKTTKRIYDTKLSFFSIKTLSDILEIKSEKTLFRYIKKLVNADVLIKMEKGKYMLADSEVSDFAIAYFLYNPSYISFETALNYHGILSQFPYEISSATSKKTAKKEFSEKFFTYTQIDKKLFWGYEKRDNFLMALPEKALLDQLYLASKGYKSINLQEYDFENVSTTKLKRYLKHYPKTRQLKSILHNLKKYI